MEKSASQKIQLGIFVIIGTLVFLAAIYFVGNKQNMFGNTSTLKAVFVNVNGLQAGNNVRYAGIDIGTVKEIEMINLLGRSDLKKGNLCNMTDGGEGFIGLIMTEERRQKIKNNSAKFWLGKKRPELSERTTKMNKDRIWTKEKRDNMSKAKSGDKSFMYGKFGKNCPTSKLLLCITTGTIYEGVSDASRKLGLNIEHIASVARGIKQFTGHKKYPGGLQFKYI